MSGMTVDPKSAPNITFPPIPGLASFPSISTTPNGAYNQYRAVLPTPGATASFNPIQSTQQVQQQQMQQQQAQQAQQQQMQQQQAQQAQQHQQQHTIHHIDAMSYNKGYTDCLNTYKYLIDCGKLYIQNAQSTPVTPRIFCNSSDTNATNPSTARTKTDDEAGRGIVAPPTTGNISDVIIEQVLKATFVYYSTNRSKIKGRTSKRVDEDLAWKVYLRLEGCGLLTRKPGASRMNFDLESFTEHRIKYQSRNQRETLEPIEMKEQHLDDKQIDKIFKKIRTEINSKRIKLLRLKYPIQINKLYPEKKRKAVDVNETNEIESESEGTINEPPLKKQKTATAPPATDTGSLTTTDSSL